MALNKDRIFKAADKYIRGNKIEKAVNEYETWLKENPKDWNTVRQVGDLYARIGRNDEAINKYSQVADHYRRDGFNVRAIATHKMVLRLDPQNETAMRNLAELQAEEGLNMEAKSHYQTLVDLYTKSGHKRRAAEVFKKLAEIDPQDLKIRYKYAEFLNKQGKPDEASLEYVAIADQFIGQGLVQEAIKILDQGRNIATSDPSLRIKLAQAHTLQGNHAQAVQMLEEVRISNPNETQVLARLGEAYLGAGNTTEAESAFQQLIQVEPGKPENVVRLAELRVAQGAYDAALEQLVPLADQQVADGEGQKAADLLQKILSKDPYHVKTLLKLAEVHTILKQETARISAYDSLCEAYNRAGDLEKAVQVAEQLIELEPESSQHKDRLKFLKSKLSGPPPAAAPPAPAARPPAARPPVAQAPAPAAPPPQPAAPAPQVQIDNDLPDFAGLEEVDLGDAVTASFDDELSLDEPAATSSAAVDLGEVIEHSQEDEENIKEKLTEAEVFVRYGLVDKAIAQLLDVLESFRFHVESREKLVEIYRDQGMNREAGEQLAQLAQVYDKLGRADDSGRAREEAGQLNPALAAQVASDELAASEEIELTLSPETESDLGDVGIDLDAPLEEEEVFLAPETELLDAPVEAMPPPPAQQGEQAPVFEEEIPVLLDEPAEAIADISQPEIDISLDLEGDLGVEEEIPLEVDLGGTPDLEVEVAGIEDDVPVEVELGTDSSSSTEELASSSPSIEVDLGGDIEVDLDGSAEDIAFSVDTEAPDSGTEEIPVEIDGLADEVEVSISSPDVDMAAAQPEAPVEEEFSVEIGLDEEEFAVEMPEAEPDDVMAQQLPDAPSGGSDDIEIDIPAVDDIAPFDDIEMPVAAEPAPPVEPPAPPVAPTPPPVEAPPPAAAAETVPEPAPEPEPVVQPPPVLAEAPSEAVSQSPWAAELEEVDEYIALGLYEDARDTLRELLKQHPGDADIVAKIEELGFSVEQLQKEADEPAGLLAGRAGEQQVSAPAPVATELELPEPAPSVAGVSPVEAVEPVETVAPVEAVETDSAPAPEPEPTPQPEPEPEVSIPVSVGSSLFEGDDDEDDDEGFGIESLVDARTPEAAPQTVETAPAAFAREEEEAFIDLASELDDEIFGTHSAVEEPDLGDVEGPLTDPGLESIFKEFRKGVEKQLGTEDYDTRYNLGIAYKEMGLLDEAIAEFQLAAKDEVRQLECCSMLGLCFMEKGMPEIAIKWFSKGLKLPGRREEEYHGLRYDMGQAFEATHQREQALEHYMDIYRDNARFRDVKDKIRDLQAALK